MTRITPVGAVVIPKRNRQTQTVRGYWLALTTEQALALSIVARQQKQTVDELIKGSLINGSWTVPFHPAQPLRFIAGGAA